MLSCLVPADREPFPAVLVSSTSACPTQGTALVLLLVVTIRLVNISAQLPSLLLYKHSVISPLVVLITDQGSGILAVAAFPALSSWSRFCALQHSPDRSRLLHQRRSVLDTFLLVA